MFRHFWKDSAAQLAVLLLITGAVFSRVAGNDFVNFDDPEYVYENPHVASGISLQNTLWALRSLDANVSYWHPLTWISHQADCQLFGLRASPQHLTSLWIHLANTGLVLALLKSLRLSPKEAFFGAGLFALHPLHVESVAWIAERKDVLYGLFWLASLLAYFRHRLGAGWCGYWASLMLFVLALMSKPSAVTLPGVLVLLELTPGLPEARGYQAEARPVLRAMAAACPRLLPFFVLSLICAGVTLTAQTRIGAAPSLSTLPLTDRADNAWMAYEWYLGKCFVPVNLCASYVRTTPPELWRVLSAMSLFLALTLWSWRLRRRVWLIAFGWLWFVITLLPTIGLLQAGPQSTADRYTYLPLLGIAMMLAGFFQMIKPSRETSCLPTPLGFSALILCGVLSFHQLQFWKNGITLFARAVAVDENNWVARLGLGMALTQERRFDEALVHLERASALPGNAAETERRLGVVYGYKGDFNRAMDHLSRSLALNSASAETHLLLSDLLTRPGRTAAEAKQGAELAARGLALRKQ